MVVQVARKMTMTKKSIKAALKELSNNTLEAIIIETNENTIMPIAPGDG